MVNGVKSYCKSINIAICNCFSSRFVYSIYSSPQTKHKEEGDKRRKLDFGDRQSISSELAKHSHTLTVVSEVLYNIGNGQVAPADVNVDEAVDIGQTMASSFRNTLSNGFHGKISNQVKRWSNKNEASRSVGRPYLTRRPSSFVFWPTSTVAANNYIPLRVVCGLSITH